MTTATRTRIGRTVALEDPRFAEVARSAGFEVVTDRPLTAVTLVIAVSADVARHAGRAGLPFLLLAREVECAMLLEQAGRPQLAFFDEATLAERLEWLATTPDAMAPGPSRVELVRALSESRVWLERLRDASVASHRSHDEDVAHRTRHLDALERRNDELERRNGELEARLLEIASNPWWRAIRRVYRIGCRLRGVRPG